MARGKVTTIKQLLRWLRDNGVEHKLTRRGHHKVYAPGGIYVMAGTPSDNRAILNVKAALRRRGLEVP